jgi:hypothetical protein
LPFFLWFLEWVKGKFSFSRHVSVALCVIVIDEFAAVIATGLQNRKERGGPDARQCPESPLMDLAGEGIPANPARSSVCGGQCEDVPAASGLSAVAVYSSPSVSICRKPDLFPLLP